VFKPFFKTAILFTLITLVGACRPATPTVHPTSTVAPTPTAPTPTAPATAVPPTMAPTLAPTTAPPPTAAVRLLREWVNLGADQGPVYDQSWSSDGRLFAAADYDQIRVWEIKVRREAGLLKGHTDFVTGLAWSPNVNVLASASEDGTVRLWDGTAFTQTAILEIGQALGCLTWSPDGRQLAVGSYTGDVHLWDVAAQEMPKTWSTHTANPGRDDIIRIAWSPDGQTIASGDLEGNIYLWDVATGQARMVLTEQTSEHARDVNGLSWSPDSSMLASAHPDGQIQLWDRATGQMLQAIAAHTAPASDVACASDVAWSPSGEFLASIGHMDRRIRLWDPETGRLYAEAHHDSLPGWSISWSPDGSKVASGCGKWQQPHVGEIIVWMVP
jgi:WD40 repeat protein